MIKYELKKIFSKRINKFLLIALFAIAFVFAYLAAESVTARSDYLGLFDVRKLSESKNKYKGMLTGELVSEIISSRKEIQNTYGDNVPNDVYKNEMEPYSDIEYFINNILTPDSEYDYYGILGMDESDANNIYELWNEGCDVVINSYGDTPSKKELIQSIYNEVETPLYYEAFDAWETMTLYAETYGLLVLSIIGILSAGLFGDEFINNAEDIFLSTKNGKGSGIINKIISGYLMATITYWSSMIFLSIISFGIMGISGAGTSYLISRPYAIYDLTYIEFYMIILLCGYIAAILSASISMLVASTTRITALASIIPIAIFCISPFVGRLTPLDTFFKLTPDQLMNLYNSARSPLVFQIGEFAFRQIPAIMVMYGGLAVLLFPVVFFGYRGTCRR